MINLNALRKLIGLAVKDNKESFTITVVEAQQFVIEAEKMHDGNCELSNYREKIESQRKQIESYKATLAELTKPKPVEDKVGNLLGSE